MLRWVLSLACFIGLAVAADITGTWKAVAKSSSGREYNITIILNKEGDKLTGSIGDDRGSVPFDEVKFENGELTLKFQYEGAYTVKLKVTDDSLDGSYTSTDGSSGTVRAKR
jgi:hypothetical protein